MTDFTTTINGVRVATVDGLPNVVIRVEWTLSGTDSGQTFELPGNSAVGPIDPNAFTPFDQLTQPQMVEWVNSVEDTPTGKFPGLKAHIQMVLDRMKVDAEGEQKPLPWAPPPAPVDETAPQ